MLEDLIPAELPAGVREVVIQRAEGNPFFVEELVRTLIDRGVLERQNGGWIAHELADELVVPDTVRAVLAARIDLLEPAEKAALQAAAVIGRTFWSSPVYELLEGLEPDLRLLEERDFIHHRSGSSIVGEREFAIKHALTREVAYESLPTMKRARFHARFAAWLERIGEGRDEDAVLLAHHYAEAVRPDTSTLLGPMPTRSSHACANGPSPGSAAPPISRSVATRSRTVSPFSTAPSSSSPAPRRWSRSGGQSRAPALCTSTATSSHRRCNKQSSLRTTIRPWRISMPTAPSRRSSAQGCGEPRLTPRSSRTGSNGRSSSQPRERSAGEGADRPLLLGLRQVSRARTRGERNRRTPGRSGHPLLRLRRARPASVRRRRL